LLDRHTVGDDATDGPHQFVPSAIIERDIEGKPLVVPRQFDGIQDLLLQPGRDALYFANVA
jgi:hypothetical protein